MKNLNGRWLLVGIAATLSVLVLQTGCVGTRLSRSLMRDERKGDFVGKYPYQGVGTDCSMIWTLVGEKHEYMDPLRGQCMVVGAGFGFVSLPFDLIFDTVLLPVDLVAWSLGFEKRKIADIKFLLE